MNGIYPMTLLAVSAISVIPADVCAMQPSAGAETVVAFPEMEKPAVWTFDDCVNWALSNSTDVRRNLLAVLQAEQDVAVAKDTYLPTVGFSTSQSVANHPFPLSGTKPTAYTGSYGVNANWVAWEGNARKYKKEMAELLRIKQSVEGEEIIRTLRLGILQAYLNILYAREAVDIAKSTLEVSAAQTERARRLMESGRSSKVDYAQIESQKATDAFGVVEAEGNLESARLDLKKILEFGPDTSVDVATVTFSDSEVLAALPALQGVYDAATGWLPAFISNALTKEIYAADIKRAEAGRMPTVSLSGAIATGTASGGGGWGSQMGHNFNENIGVNVSVPIFDANSTKRSVAKARLAALEYDLTQKNLLDDLSQTLERLYIDSENARARYTAGLARVEAAQLTADLTRRQFELGAVNTLELLTAHNDLLNARYELLQSKYLAILAAKTVGFYASGDISLK